MVVAFCPVGSEKYAGGKNDRFEHISAAVVGVIMLEREGKSHTNSQDMRPLIVPLLNSKPNDIGLSFV